VDVGVDTAQGFFPEYQHNQVLVLPEVGDEEDAAQGLFPVVLPSRCPEQTIALKDRLLYYTNKAKVPSDTGSVVHSSQKKIQRMQVS
jgi:hypothetical protein